MLAERHAELTALAQLVGDGGTVVVEGPAGIGKSALLAAAQALGTEAGRTVLCVRATRLERAFAFGVAEQLLGVTAPAADDGGLTGIRQLTDAVQDRAATTDLLLVVDDAQWSDPESLRLLAYVARRLTGPALALAIGVRTGEPDAPRELLAALGDAATLVVRPRPLSDAAAAALVESWADGVASALRASCVRTADGNPLYLRELSRAAADGRDLVPDAVTGLGADVERRIAAAGSEAERVARAVAVLGDGVTLGAVATLSGLDPAAAGAAATTLQRSEILAGSGTYRFTHPLLRAVVEDGMDDGTALTLRRAAAELL
ncbi:MAG: transcriptional regulator, LuxR family, partial [Solirubrobacterales bacterium]|nr:transcriptional regulator, LuxR family [Solirubrobacterales bacterium]